MKKILVVEDNENIRFLYKRLFRNRKDVELTDCDSSETALVRLQDLKPDLIIVDISLPGMNGLEFTRTVKINFPDIKVLIITGHEPERYYDEAINAGAIDLISKDTGPELVQKCLDLLN